MRVGEGSPKKKQIEKMRNILKRNWKKGIEKVILKTLENHLKRHPKTMPKP